MCLEIGDEEKAQPAIGFPDGWRFYFKATDASSTVTLPIGLVLISPWGKSFDSLDAAFRRHRKSLERKPNLMVDFYEHIGEDCADESIEPRSGHSQPQKRSDPEYSASLPMANIIGVKSPTGKRTSLETFHMQFDLKTVIFSTVFPTRRTTTLTAISTLRQGSL
jgi:hypothetical protein